MDNRKVTHYRLLRHALAAPFLWMMIIPVLVTDLLMELYHHIAFPLYGISLVERRHYIRVLDRARLPYLRWWEKFGCAYCGYVNGWLHYASVIAARTEQYWCGIRHRDDGNHIPATHEQDFVPYGDAEEYHRRYDPVAKADQSS